MKRLIAFFGLLDLGIVVVYFPRVPEYVHALVFGQLATRVVCGICLLVMASLAASGVGLLLGRRWAMALNYMQFPFRIALAFLSFGWVADLMLTGHSSAQFAEAVWMSIVAIEGLRLGMTMMLHYASARKELACPSIS
jgi:hypothetical protein